ncbi:MAG: acyltransferase family protein [Rhodothermales bacterium]
MEGLRGIAVLLVVLYHAGVPGFAGGYVGVDVFFVLSGYLITGILAAEVVRTGTVDLRRFYARRARRLLPAMAVLLVAVTAFAFVFYSPLEQGPIADTAVATAGYFSNFHFAAGATDYLAAEAETNPLLHTWSLSVEEQFYFVWPVLVLLALTGVRRRGSGAPSGGAPSAISQRRLIWVMVAVCVVSFALTLYLMGTLRTHWAFFGSPTRAWEFGLGALGAMVPRLTRDASGWRFGSLEEVPAASRWLGWLGLAGILVAGCLYSARTPFPGFAALLPAVATVLALRAGTARTDTSLARALAWRPLQELGRLSYSWYLWHWPVLVFAAGMLGHLPLWQRLAFAAGSLVLAEASYRLVEDPVRHHRFLAERSGRGLALAGMLTAFGVGLALGWGHLAGEAAGSPEQQAYAAAVLDRYGEGAEGCIGGMTETDVIECEFGDESGPVVLLLGDSHADHWLPAMTLAAELEGWHLVTLTHSGCDMVDTREWSDTLGRFHDECSIWRDKTVVRVGELSPALVVVSSAATEDEYADGTWSEPTTAFYRRVAAVSAEAGGRVVHLRDTPRPGFALPACLSRKTWRGDGTEACAFSRESPYAAAIEAQSAAARRVEGVREVDLSEAVCPDEACEPVRDGVVTFRDDNHFTAAFAATLAPALADALGGELGDGPLRGTPVDDAPSAQPVR